MSRSDPAVIRALIIHLLPDHPRDIVSVIAEEFGISRQAAHRHVKKLVQEGIVRSKGLTRRTYSLVGSIHTEHIRVDDKLQEDRVWSQVVEKRLEGLPKNVLHICYHGFTEMLNNVIDHSESPEATIEVERLGNNVTLVVSDSGIGIFEKIRARFGLDDARQAILELSKGKLTTDPSHHSGEGIYFTSRMFDKFSILAGDLYFLHRNTDGGDWLIQHPSEPKQGTRVTMTIAADSSRTSQEVFEQFASSAAGNDLAFSRTHVPLSLAVYGTEALISRSQAKRVLRRFDRFKEVMLDFTGIDSIGQAFADEIFRVFKLSNPEIRVVAVGANDQIKGMIARAVAALDESQAEEQR